IQEDLIVSDSLDGFTEGDTQKEKQKVKQPKPFFNDVEESADRRHLRWTKSGVTLAMTILVAVMNWMVISMLYHVLDEELSLIRSGFMRADERTVTTREGANKRGNSSRLTQSFHFFMFEPIFSPVNALNQPI
ncbi:TPA: hypothetical protein ACGGHL_004656, partial [Escherichia coli]